MIEMGEFDSLKPTLIKLLSIIEVLLMIHASSSSHSSPKVDTKVPRFVQDTDQLPWACRASCFGSVALVRFLLLLLRHRSSQLTYKCDSPFGQISKSDWVQLSPVNSRHRNCIFNSSLPFHSWQKIKLETKTNRFWYQQRKIKLM